MGSSQKILVIEDDSMMLRLVAQSLELQKYDYRTAENGMQAIAEAVSFRPDIIITDLGLPDMDGIELIERIRTWSNVPIIVISARTDDEDIVTALDSGADDYLRKPFNVTEMLARIRAAIRRSETLSLPAPENSVFENGGLKIDFATRTVYTNGAEVHLTPNEYKLLCILAGNTDKVLTYSYLINAMWPGGHEKDKQILRVFMSGLRKKIEPEGHDMTYIYTSMGIGYYMPKITANKE